MKIVLSFVFAITVGYSFELYLIKDLSSQGQHFAMDIDYSNWLRIILLFLLMLFGIISGTLYDRLKKYKNNKIVQMDLFKFWQNVSLYKGIFLAPLVFYAIYIKTSTIPDDITAAFLAFENGFFWEKIFSSGDNTK